MTTNPDQLADQLAEARARTAQLQLRADALDAAEAEGRRAAEHAYYTDVHGPRSHAERDSRDALKDALDELAAKPTLDLGELFTAFVELKDADSRAAAMGDHASMINSVSRPARNPHTGIEQYHGVHVGAEYDKVTFSSYIDNVIQRRNQPIRQARLTELQAQAYERIEAAAAAARTKAAGD
jgi:hypothetical protein